MLRLTAFPSEYSSFHDKSWSKLTDSRYLLLLKLGSSSLRERAAGLLLLDCTTVVSICDSHDVLRPADINLDPQAWSAPSAIGSAGMGVGGQAGAEVTDFLIVLNTRAVSTDSIHPAPQVSHAPLRRSNHLCLPAPSPSVEI